MNFRHFCLWALVSVLVGANSLEAASPSRRALLGQMEMVMGSFPDSQGRCSLDVKVSEEVDCGDYIRKFLTYQSEPGARVPAYLLVPKTRSTNAISTSSGKPFGILTLHQTHSLGQKVVVGLGQSPNDEYAVELVRRGFICLAPAYPHLANYAPDLSGYQSGTMKAIWDNSRGLDLLASYAGADPDRFAAIGHSLGGHNGLFTAAFDERIKVVVSSCGFDSFRDYMNGNIKGWTSVRYMPRLLDFAPDKYPFDFDTVLTAIAPRAIFVSAPMGDTNFKWASVDRLVAQAKKEAGATWNIRVEHPNCAHLFPKETREEAYRFIEAGLRE